MSWPPRVRVRGRPPTRSRAPRTAPSWRAPVSLRPPASPAGAGQTRPDDHRIDRGGKRRHGVQRITAMDRETVRADFDRIARLPGGNRSGDSEDRLLRYLPKSCERGLEIGCGKGLLTR